MKITTSSSVLAQEIRYLSKIAASKTTIPILSHILLRAEDQLYLYATDLELAMSSSCPAQVSEMGEMTLPAKALLDILEQLPNVDVTISEGSITARSFKSRLASLPTQDFPPFPEVIGQVTSFPATTLHALIERVSYAITDKTQQYVLKGALLTVKGNIIAMVGTDGKRLSITTANCPSEAEVTTVIPIKTLTALVDQEPNGNVDFSSSQKHLFFTCGKRVIVSRMLDGAFPAYQRVIPRANDHKMVVDRFALQACLRRVGIVSEVVVLTIEPGRLTMSARSAEIGDASEELVVQYEGPEFKGSVTWKLVMDFLDCARETSITIAVKDGKTPLLLTDGPDFMNVVMLVQN